MEDEREILKYLAEHHPNIYQALRITRGIEEEIIIPKKPKYKTAIMT